MRIDEKEYSKNLINIHFNITHLYYLKIYLYTHIYNALLEMHVYIVYTLIYTY